MASEKPVRLIQKCAAEAIGTFALVFAGAGAVVIDAVTKGQITHVGVAITFGLVIMTMIYAVGDVSGAHFNSAVTCAFWLARRLPGRMVVPYVLSQAVGAFAASFALLLMFGNAANLGATLPSGPWMQSLVLETILTAILMFVILCVSTGPKETGLMAGIAIGGVIGLEAMFGGPISGASMNPMRSLAPAMVSGHLEFLWVYLIGPMTGAALAIPCWQLTRGRNP